MIWVLLQLESPWQRNDAISFFFIYLCSLSIRRFWEKGKAKKGGSSLGRPDTQAIIFVFLCTRSLWRNRLREYVPAIIASIIAKFQQILWERFGNILKRSFKNLKVK